MLTPELPIPYETDLSPTKGFHSWTRASLVTGLRYHHHPCFIRLQSHLWCSLLCTRVSRGKVNAESRSSLPLLHIAAATLARNANSWCCNRLLGLVLSYLASNKHFRLSVDTVDFLVVRGVRLQLHQVSKDTAQRC